MKKRLILIFGVSIALSIALFLLPKILRKPSFITTPTPLDKLEGYDSSNGTILLQNVPNGNTCILYVSGPTKVIKVLGNATCESLEKRKIELKSIVSLFEGKRGTYTIFVLSDRKRLTYMSFVV